MTRFLALAILIGTGSAAPAQDGSGYWAPDHFGAQPLGSDAGYGRVGAYIGYDGRRYPRQFSRDDGYFQGRGGGVEIMRGKASFDYDRDYPYDFPRGWTAERPMAEFAGGRARAPQCTFEPVRDRRSEQPASVRICRR